MREIQIACKNDVGLHARPAALFVKSAARFKSKIKVRNFTTGGDWVDAKSILRVLSIGVEQSHVIEIQADGEDEQAALQTLEALIQSDFVVAA
jgi:phosphotransferase system HPr (HPr) family protein